MSTVKGSALRGARAWLQAELRSDLERFVAGTPPELQAILRGQVILAGSKYPRVRLEEIFERMVTYWPGQVHGRLGELGAYIANEDLGGVYSIFLKLGSVDGTLRVLARVWGRYFDEGRAALIDTRPGAYTFEVVDRSLHPLHPYLIAGYVRRAVELAGGRSTEVQYTRDETTSDRHLFHVRWR